MKKAAQSGLPVAIWTVDNPRWVARAIGLGNSAVITNDVSHLIKMREDLLK